MKRTLILVLGMLAGFVRAEGGPGTYRWQDESGATHYSDQIPPDQAKQRRSKLSPQGQEIAVIEAAKTAEQLRREHQLKQLRAQQEKILSEQRDQDLALLRTYRSVEEMYTALKGQLDTLDSTAKIIDANRQRQRSALASQEQRAADLERQGQPVPQNLKDLIAATRHQIANYDGRIREIEAEKGGISERFAKSVARFKAIQAQRQQNANEQPGTSFSISSDKGGKDGIVISAVACAVGAVCDRAWELARDYILRNSAASGLSVETDRILQTPNPAADKDFGMTVTRIPAKSEDILFLDIRCRPSSIGEELCSSVRVKDLRANFKSFIEMGLGARAPDPGPQQ